MATLQVLDNTDTSHNYRNKNVIGHGGRTSDSDVNKYYKESIFGGTEQEGESRP